MSVVVGKGTESRRSRRNITLVGVDPVDLDGNDVGVGGIAGLVDEFGRSEAVGNMAESVEDMGDRRAVDAIIVGGCPAPLRSRRIRGGVHELNDRGRARPVRQHDRRQRLRSDRIGEMLQRLGVQVRELQRENVADQLLQIRRQRRVGDADGAVADVDLLPGLVDLRDRRQRVLVEQDVGTGGAVRLDQHLKFRARLAARAGNAEVDLDQHRGAADAHGGDRGIDLHVAVFCGLAGDERDGPRHQAEQRRIVRPVGIVDHFVEHHSRIRRQAEHGAVNEGDAERRIGAGLDDVAFFDVVALVQDDRDAVADRGRGADELGDMADHMAGGDAAVGLRVFGVAGQRVDEIAGEMGAIGRRQRGALLALEVIVQHQLLLVVGKHEVDAGPLEISVEEQLRVRNDDGACGRVRRVRGNAFHMGMPIGMQARPVSSKLGVEFAGVVQRPHRKRLIFK